MNNIITNSKKEKKPKHTTATAQKQKITKPVITPEKVIKYRKDDIIAESRKRELDNIKYEQGKSIEKLLEPLYQDIVSSLKKLPNEVHNIFLPNEKENRIYMLTVKLTVNKYNDHDEAASSKEKKLSNKNKDPNRSTMEQHVAVDSVNKDNNTPTIVVNTVNNNNDMLPVVVDSINKDNDKLPALFDSVNSSKEDLKDNPVIHKDDNLDSK